MLYFKSGNKMCSRFFIDFPDIESQTRKINSYLSSHFNSDDELELRSVASFWKSYYLTTFTDSLFWSFVFKRFLLRFNFLLSLQSVVDDSTICLMSHERKQVLDLIMNLAKQVFLTDFLPLRFRKAGRVRFRGSRETRWYSWHNRVTPSKTHEFLESPCLFRS